MNRQELEKALLDEGWDPMGLFISKEIHIMDHGLLVYQDKEGLWIAETQERGNRFLLEKAPTEEEVCRRVYDRFSPKKLQERNLSN